ncbi:hypothetical protein [Bacillus coreaensis]
MAEIENEYIKVLAGLNKKIDNSIESANQVASGKYPPEQLHTVYKMIESKRGELFEVAKTKLEENISNKKIELEKRINYKKERAKEEKGYQEKKLAIHQNGEKEKKR